MDKAAKYQMPPTLGRDYPWKKTILIPMLVLGLFFGVFACLQWRDPSRDLERSHLYRIAFSHPTITAITGDVTNASFALIPKEERLFLARGVPEDWKRVKQDDAVQGTARMLIFGQGGGGIFILSYRYVPSSDSFVVWQIESLDRPLLEESASRKNR